MEGPGPAPTCRSHLPTRSFLTAGLWVGETLAAFPLLDHISHSRSESLGTHTLGGKADNHRMLWALRYVPQVRQGSSARQLFVYGVFYFCFIANFH